MNYIAMFADDTKFYHTITSESDCDILQRDLNTQCYGLGKEMAG